MVKPINFVRDIDEVSSNTRHGRFDEFGLTLIGMDGDENRELIKLNDQYSIIGNCTFNIAKYLFTNANLIEQVGVEKL